MGRSESEVPLMQLAYLATPVVSDNELPDGGLPDAGAPLPTVPFDPTNLQRPFYDDLCCAKPGENCLIGDPPYPACCPNSTCVVPDGGGTSGGKCQKQCGKELDMCGKDSDCCAGHYCDGIGRCRPCKIEPQPCSRNGGCCSKYYCGFDNTCLFEAQ
jgi:hypothetical protein